MDTLTSTIIIVGLVAIVSIVLAVTLMGGIDSWSYKAALAPFADCLPGNITGPAIYPRFTGVFNNYPFSIRYTNVRLWGKGRNLSATDETRIKFTVRTAHRIRILNRDARILPLFYRLTLLKRMKTGIEKLDNSWIVYAGDREAARPAFSNPSFVDAVTGIFKIPYDRIDIEPDSIEIRERHRSPDAETVYAKENILKAARDICSLARRLQV